MIDINKKYRTRDGREVRIYATDGGQLKDTVHGAVLEKGCWWITSWDRNGEWSIDDSRWSLIEVRPRHKRTVWVTVWRNGYTETSSKPEWRNGPLGCGEEPISCIKVELDFEEGEGL
jgi:hypothetical protein